MERMVEIATSPDAHRSLLHARVDQEALSRLTLLPPLLTRLRELRPTQLRLTLLALWLLTHLPLWVHHLLLHPVSSTPVPLHL